MPSYILSPFKNPPQLFVPGFPAYVWGSFNDKIGPTTGNVLSDSGTGSVSTYTVQILAGNVPKVGSLLTVIGTANAAGAYNITNVALASVSAANNPDNGVYILTAAGSGSSATLSDAGQFIIPQPEVAEALVTDAKSVPVVVPYNIMNANLNEAITVVVSFPSLPTSIIVYLQQAVQDIDAEYTTVATVVTVSGGQVQSGGQITVDPTLGRFFRLLNGDMVGGTLPTIIAKLLI